MTAATAPKQPALFGPDVTPADRKRLAHQYADVEALMRDGAWRTLGEIAWELDHKHPEASISARLRDLRRAGYTVERRRKNGAIGGLFQYRVRKEND